MKEELLPKNQFSRPGFLRHDTLGVVLHWTGAAGQENDQTRRYFELLACQDELDERPDRYASAHYIVGIDGEQLRVIPDEEIAYHVGAVAYTGFIQPRMPQYTTNAYQGTPNWALIGIELCHPDTSGVFSFATIGSAVTLCRELLDRYHLPVACLYRHYDITGKNCPKYWVENPDEWELFGRKVEAFKHIRR